MERTKVFLTEADRYVFGKGTHYEIYEKMGAHCTECDGKREFILQSGHRRLSVFRLWETLTAGTEAVMR